MNLIKRHKGLAIITLLTLVLAIVLFLVFSRMIFSTGKGEYGDRLKGIPPISDKTIKDAVAKIKEEETVTNAKIRVQGKIVRTTIIFDEKTTKAKAKEIATKVLEYFEDETKDVYDFEFLLNQKVEVGEDEEDTSFAVAGNKHADSEVIAWTKD